MTDTTETPNADLINPDPEPTAPYPGSNNSSDSSPKSEAAPAADQPASIQEPTGQAPAGTEGSATTPGVIEALSAEGQFAPATQREVRANLNAIEQLALYWGGETGTKIRNYVGRIRELLGR